MILHLYLNEERLKDISIQLHSSESPVETKTIDKEINLNGEISGGIPSWMEYLGFQGDAKLGSEGKIAISKEIKPLSIELALLKIFKEKIIKNNFIHVTDHSLYSQLYDKNGLVRIQSKFKILVEGADALERVANFENLSYIQWESHFADFKIVLSTSKESYTGRTPIFQCLSQPNQSLDLEVLGIITKNSYSIDSGQKIISILPVYFGVALDI